MLINTVTYQTQKNTRFCLHNVAEIVCTNFGKTTVRVNDRTILPGYSITFAKCFFIPKIELKVEFEESEEDKKLEISYLVRDDA